MKQHLLTILLMLSFFVQEGSAQSLKQYFDGADTSVINSLIVVKDTAAGNIWMVGKPRKAKFNSASTVPNVIITDTINNYPVNNTSSFTIKFKDSTFLSTNVIAVRWRQKLDLQKKEDGAIVEFSKNDGPWQNVFNNTNIFNFYGYLQTNKDTLTTGEYAFSGTDTLWRDIWLCFRGPYLTLADSVAIRYTLKTDSISNNREGWMIDNMLVQRTLFHTVGKVESGHDSRVYPTNTTGTIIVEAEHTTQAHFITSLKISNSSGSVVRVYNDQQQRFILDLSSYPRGTYYINVVTNLGKETFPIVLHD